MFDLLPAVFEPSANQWKRVAPATEDIPREALTLATMNIWFGNLLAAERYRAIADLLAAHQPDFIAMQEVTPGALRTFLRQEWIQEGYFVSDCDGTSLGDYGVTIFSRMPLVSIHLHSLTSYMGRNLLVAEVLVNGAPLHIATVHLESTKPMADVRGQQLGEIFEILGKAKNVALMGDFNFCASWPEENDRLDAAYTDVWSHLRPDEPGFTEDTAINRMRYLAKGEHKQVRFDRFLLKSKHWSAETNELFGTQPISPDDPDIFPSDHFGLLCKLTVC